MGIWFKVCWKFASLPGPFTLYNECSDYGHKFASSFRGQILLERCSKANPEMRSSRVAQIAQNNAWPHSIMSLNDIWDEPIASPPKPAPTDGDSSPLKRPRQPLFLHDSDSDYERPTKRATPAPPPARPDVDALFENLDKDGEGDDLTYKPLAPTLDLTKLAKEAEERHARARQTAPSQTLAGGSTAGGTEKDQSGKDDGKGKPGDGEKKGRKVLPKLDEERLVGPEGFPLLIKDIKGFVPKGKGNEVHPHSL